jgi:protein FLOWERING LOCUS T
MSNDPLVLARVIGDVLDPFVRSHSFKISYNNRIVVNGVDLRPTAVANKPRVGIGGNDLRVSYTLVKHFFLIFFSISNAYFIFCMI